MSFFYSSVPLVNPKKCPLASHHNLIAKAFNQRLSNAGPACAWAIFYYADGIFTGMRNTATPGQPLGVNPPEDEWWKVYSQIDLPTALTGEGNWPLTPAGMPEGANVMNPLNAYIFGRVTSENKIAEALKTDVGPFAEGNLFDGLVESSRAVLSNKTYWSDSFRQRGAYQANSNYDPLKAYKWRQGSSDNEAFRHFEKYLPGPNDAAWFSRSLFWSGRSSDHFFPEYASNTVYMRYPPAVQGGAFMKYGVPHYPQQGVLKRKNAAKDLLRWVLWAYTYYFRGSEQQRSLFCERKTWDSPLIDFAATDEYVGQQTFGMRRSKSSGPLNICQVGFDMFSYMTRQNVFAPCIAEKVQFRSLINPNTGAVGGTAPAVDNLGYAKISQYRPTLKFEIKQGSESNNFLGAVNGAQIDGGYRNLVSESGKSGKDSSPNDNVTKVMSYENYDDFNEIGQLTGGRMYGKSIRVINDYEDDSFNTNMLFRDSGRNHLQLRGLASSKQRGIANHCMAGYYLQTNAIDNSNMTFKLKIWGGDVGRNNWKKLHETIIWKKYSYVVNRSHNAKGYIYNKMFYFKNPISNYGALRFEIVPVLEDKFEGNAEVKSGASAYNNYKKRREEYGFDKVISFGDPWSNVTQYEKVTSYMSASSVTTVAQVKDASTGKTEPAHILVPDSEVSSLSLSDGDAISVWMGAEKTGGGFVLVPGGYVRGGKPFFVKVGSSSGGKTKIYISERRDSSVCGKKGFWVNLDEQTLKNGETVNNWLANNASRKIVIAKLELDDNLFSATIEPLIVMKQRPSFQDLYSLLRVATAQSNRGNPFHRMIQMDTPGVGIVGHNFYDANRIWKNYLKYGSGQNIYGSDVVPALMQKVSSSPLYESARKFVSSYMRMADRHDLVDYRKEGGKGVLYFRRFNKYLPKKARATVLKHMEPSIEPAGAFYEGSKGNFQGFDIVNNLNELPNANYKPLIRGKKYYVYGNGIKYMGDTLVNGTIITARTQSYIDNASEVTQDNIGLYELDGITKFDSSSMPVDVTKNFAQSISGEAVPSPYESYPFESNEWIMFMNSVHYHPATSNIYKPSVYGDIMGFLNNRCHHRSREYERSTSVKYDIIRQELLRVPLSPRNVPGPRLHVFLSKSPSNMNRIFNTNNTENIGIVNDGYGGISYQQSNLAEYGVAGYRSAYLRSCPAVTQKPYKVVSCTLVDNFGSRLGFGSFIANPSSKKVPGQPSLMTPVNLVRVELDRPLDGVKDGPSLVDSRGWSNVSASLLKKERYRTDENAVVEYLMHKHLGRSGYNCKRRMIGDYGTSTDVHEGIGYRPFGACFPRFYFLKLIPYVGVDAPLKTDPYAQMDFYLRAMAGQFVTPFYNFYNAPGQVESLNWKYSELASRSSEEDPTSYYYVDPREITNG